MKIAKEQMEQGVKYPGYGFINEFNEFCFTPSEIGSRKEQKKLVKEGEDFSIYHTKNYIIFHGKIDRKLNLPLRVENILKLMNHFIEIVRNYEI